MTPRVPLILLTAACIGLGYTTRANAIGCLSGGAAGAVAGHMAHHGVLGAMGGCIAGHEYNKHQQKQAAQKTDEANQPVDTHGNQPHQSE
jgi:uncharacterized membrane protein YebE (DUF533 family)